MFEIEQFLTLKQTKLYIFNVYVLGAFGIK